MRAQISPTKYSLVLVNSSKGKKNTEFNFCDSTEDYTKALIVTQVLGD